MKFNGECSAQNIGYQQLTPHECARLCTNDPLCMSFTYDFHPTSLYPCSRKYEPCPVINLKQSSTVFTYEKKSTIKYTSNRYDYLITRGDCPGNDLGTAKHHFPLEFCAGNSILIVSKIIGQIQCNLSSQTHTYQVCFFFQIFVKGDQNAKVSFSSEEIVT